LDPRYSFVQVIKSCQHRLGPAPCLLGAPLIASGLARVADVDERHSPAISVAGADHEFDRLARIGAGFKDVPKPSVRLGQAVEREHHAVDVIGSALQVKRPLTEAKSAPGITVLDQVPAHHIQRDT
jgi:hypothetical protein